MSDLSYGPSLLSDQSELHGEGVRLMAQRLQRQGYTLHSVATDIQYDPQIIAEKDGHRIHVAVRTGVLPSLGKLECEALRGELLDWARQDHADCFIARIGLNPRRYAPPTSRATPKPRHRLFFAPLER